VNKTRWCFTKVRREGPNETEGTKGDETGQNNRRGIYKHTRPPTAKSGQEDSRSLPDQGEGSVEGIIECSHSETAVGRVKKDRNEQQTEETEMYRLDENRRGNEMEGENETTREHKLHQASGRQGF